LSYVRRHHIALLALFVAMGGTSYAAFKLPKNSVGSKQIKANAVNSSKVKNGSLLAGDFRTGQLPAGAQGPKGDRGDACLPSDPACKGPQGPPGDKGNACLPSDPACKGPQGDTGAQGPGALSFDGQFDSDGVNHTFAVINGMNVQVNCTASNITVFVNKTSPTAAFFAWGTAIEDGTLVPVTHPPGNNDITGMGAGRVELSVIAQATEPGQASKWTRFDVLGLRATKCNAHALIIPPS
jgi:hypothetical protein